MNLSDYKPMLRSKGALVGRVLLALLFVSAGANMLMGGIGNTAMYFESIGLPLAGVLAILVIAVKLVGGIAMMLGVKTEEAAAALFVFTGLTILIAHLDTADINLWKNLSIMGGLIYVMAYGPGDGWKLNLKKGSDEPTPPLNSQM